MRLWPILPVDIFKFQVKFAEHQNVYIFATTDQCQPTFAQRQKPPSSLRGWSQVWVQQIQNVQRLLF